MLKQDQHLQSRNQKSWHLPETLHYLVKRRNQISASNHYCNALKAINLPSELYEDKTLNKRAEALSVEQFVALTQKISACQMSQ